VELYAESPARTMQVFNAITARHVQGFCPINIRLQNCDLKKYPCSILAATFYGVLHADAGKVEFAGGCMIVSFFLQRKMG
jgi:hypothetical protein